MRKAANRSWSRSEDPVFESQYQRKHNYIYLHRAFADARIRTQVLRIENLLLAFNFDQELGRTSSNPNRKNQNTEEKKG